MTKRLDPEIKAMRAAVRALSPLEAAEQKRVIEWVTARGMGVASFRLPFGFRGILKGASDDDQAPASPEREALPIHDGGCQCWPHVSQQDAVRAIEAVALAEYRDGLRRRVPAAQPSDAG